MTYYDDEEENGQHQPPQGNRQSPSLRADFRADPSFSPRAGYQQPPQHPGHPVDDDGQDGYVQPAPYAAPAPHHPADDYVQPAAAPTYRAPAADAYVDPQAHGSHPHAGYHQGPSAQQQAQDAYYQQYEQQHGHYHAEPPRRRNLVNIAVVGAAVVVFGGVIFWAYNQGMRAGTESVAPILRADPAPTKIRPEQPGGMEVPHQDKLVYDRLNPANGAAPGEVERLLPPPETPMERPRAAAEPPADEIMPMAEEGEGQVSSLPVEEQGYQPTQTPGLPSYAPPLPQQQQPRTVTPAPQPAQQQATVPTQPAPAPTHQPSVQTQVPPATTRPLTSPPATTVQPRPTVPPPATVAQAPVAAQPRPVPQTTLAPPPVVQSKPAATAPVASGGAAVRVQVAAVDSEAKAAAEWQRLQRKFAGELGGLSMRTVRVELPKGIFYRIQGGPIDEARAKQICAAMTAQGAGCSIVR